MDERKVIFEFLGKFNPYKDNFTDNRNELLTRIPNEYHGKIFNELTQIIRNYILLEYILNIPLKKQQKISKKARAAGLPALYEIIFQNKPEHITNEWVRLIKAKKERGFLNWMLREILRQTKGNLENVTFPKSRVKHISTLFSYPLDLTVKISNQLSKKMATEIFKLSFEEVKPVFMLNGITDFDTKRYKEIFPDIYKLNEYSKILTLQNEGKAAIFDKTSYYPVLVLKAKPKDTVLDLCGAPGNKSFMIYNILKGKVNITMNELKSSRFKMLKNNVEKWGMQANVLNYDGIKLQSEIKYDKILIDAPCTNIGVVANKPDVKYKFTHGKLENLRSTQLQLMKNGIKLLRSGGELVYAVCSYLEDEIEPIYNFVKNEKELEIIDDIPFALKKYFNGKYIKIIPNKDEPIGFQILKIRKS